FFPCPCLFVSFLWPLLPPSSTLFPYTTLFRSHRAVGVRQRVPLGADQVDGGLLGLAVPLVGHVDRADLRGADGPLEVVVGVDRLDRKSTRLNSSHVEISYAVFCLKKKNKNTAA